MDLIEESFRKLFPEKDFNFSAALQYSGRLKAYGANIKMGYGRIVLTLSRKWRGVSREIQMGLIQELMIKLFKPKDKSQINSLYIDLYNNFIKSLHKTVAKDRIHPLLEESFNRVNEKYFLGAVERPNLVLGRHSTSTFGTYDYRTDTIRISQVLVDDASEGKNQEVMDYVMYHEMLHKFNSFKSNLGNNRFHTSKFREHERIFENSEMMERKLRLIASKRFYRNPAESKRKGFFDFFFE